MTPSTISQSSTFKTIFTCRVCWKVTFAAFLAILTVEAIVLIPSYRNYALDWQQSRSNEALAAIQVAITLAGENANNLSWLSNSMQQIADSAQLLGWRILSIDGQQILASAGDLPILDKPGSSTSSFWRDFIFEDFHDIGWNSEQLQAPFQIQVRLNAADLQPVLGAFVVRILGLVAIISLFVTIVIMFVLKHIILSPVLTLRSHLTQAGEDIHSSDGHIIHTHRSDEIGDVISSFNTMLENTVSNLNTIRQNEEALKQAHDSLEVKVQQRTAKLSHEIRERQQVELQLRKSEQDLFLQANYDDLTGLPNRLLAMDRLNMGLRHTRRNDCIGALMFIDLDNFKDINDTLGHSRGDELLRQTAIRLSSVLRDTDSLINLDLTEMSLKANTESHSQDTDDVVARIGGDEFMIILPEIANESDAAMVASRLRDSCLKSFELDGNEVFISASIGIAIFPQDGKDPAELMICADTALYSAKDEGRNAYRFFAPEMNHESGERIKIERLLRNSLIKQELEVHYQPLVDLESRMTIGVEALLRWHSDELGIVAPDRFIPIAESSGMILPIGEWVLMEACRTIAELAKLGFPLRIAVNVSARQFRDSGFVNRVEKTIAEYALSPSMVEIEITESLLVGEHSKAFRSIEKLRELGVRLSIDDFGTGYSSLGYLRRFSVDTLKIDRSFTASVCEDSKDASLIRTIVNMAENFGLETIAEGVETNDQLNFLKNSGCNLAQGYYLGKPMPLQKLMAYLREQQLGFQHQAS